MNPRTNKSCDSNKPNVSFEPNSPTLGRPMRILKPHPSCIEPNFVKVRDSTANTDTKPHAYNPLCCDGKLHDHFYPNPIESNSKPIEARSRDGHQWV